jgi:hypothetical protein
LINSQNFSFGSEKDQIMSMLEYVMNNGNHMQQM